MKGGVLITFEGIEGSGKSTHLHLAEEFLRAEGLPTVVTFEPGATPLGRELRQLLLSATLPLQHLAELFLFLADRAEHVRQVIKPALEAGKVVLCDRFVDSTTAYQGYGRGLDLAFVKEGNRRATGGIWPRLTILLDCEVEVGLARTRGVDRFEEEGVEFHKRVREGYLRIAEEEPLRVKVVDSSHRPKGDVQGEIRGILRGFLEEWVSGGL